MINQLAKLANHLDKKGLSVEADRLDKIIQKLAAKGVDRTQNGAGQSMLDFPATLGEDPGDLSPYGETYEPATTRELEGFSRRLRSMSPDALERWTESLMREGLSEEQAEAIAKGLIGGGEGSGELEDWLREQETHDITGLPGDKGADEDDDRW